MFLREFGKFDRALIALALISLIGSVYFIIDDAWLFDLTQSEIAELDRIGSVKLSRNDVRRRTKNAFHWLKLREKRDFYQDDTIYTGKNSEALLVTDNGEEISIAPNSLVVISSTAGSILINVDYGTVLGRVGKDSKLLIGSQNGITEFSGEDGLIKVDVNAQNELKVSVLEGRVDVIRPGTAGADSLGPNQSTNLGPGKRGQRDRRVIELITPISKKILKSSDEPTLFVWKASEPFPSYRLQISTSESFDDLVIDESLTESQRELANLPRDQQLFWRVIGIDADTSSIKSASSSFSLVIDRPPVALFPFPGARFNYPKSESGEDGGLDLILRWTGPHSTLWELELSSQSDFTSGTQSFRSETNFKAVGRLQSGVYYWRVRSKDVAQAPWSEPASFQLRVRDNTIISVPQPIAFEDKIILEFRTGKLSYSSARKIKASDAEKLLRKAPSFEWKGFSRARAYQLEVARDPNFEVRLVEIETTATAYTWTQARPGDFYWRVRAIPISGEPGEFSDNQIVRMRMKPPASTSRAEISETISEFARINTPPPPFNLSWRPLPFAETYEVEFASTDEFVSPLRVRVNDIAKKFQAPTPGTYYWRVRALSKDGLALSDFSAGYSIRFFRVYHNPAMVSQLKQLTPSPDAAVVLVGTGDTNMRLMWTHPFRGSTYRVQLSSEPDFSRVLWETETPNNYALINAELPVGWIYWRIRVEREGTVSPWTGSTRFIVSREKGAFDFTDANIQSGPGKYRKVAAVTLTPELKPLPPPTEITYDPTFVFSLDLNRIPASVSEFQELTAWRPLVRDWPRFSWPVVTKAEAYHLQIARDPNFSELVKSIETKSPNFQWQDAIPGVFYLRVRSLGNPSGGFGATQSIQLNSDEPLVTMPEVVVEVRRDPRFASPEPGPIQLKWSFSAFARKYEVEIRGDLNKTLVVANTQTEIELPKFGSYQWRVRALDKFQRPISDFSALRRLQLERVYRNPAATTTTVTPLYPPPDAKLTLATRGEIQIPFHWQSRGAENFELQISREARFSNILVSERAKAEFWTLQKDLPAGNYYWRVGQLDATGTRQWSPIRQFQLERKNPPVIPAKPMGSGQAPGNQ